MRKVVSTLHRQVFSARPPADIVLDRALTLPWGGCPLGAMVRIDDQTQECSISWRTTAYANPTIIDDGEEYHTCPQCGRQGPDKLMSSSSGPVCIRCYDAASE